MNKVCVLKNQSNRNVSLTRPTGGDATTVKQGFLLERQNTLYSPFIRVKPASLPAMLADFFIRVIVVILTQPKAPQLFPGGAAVLE